MSMRQCSHASLRKYESPSQQHQIQSLSNLEGIHCTSFSQIQICPLFGHSFFGLCRKWQHIACLSSDIVKKHFRLSF